MSDKTREAIAKREAAKVPDPAKMTKAELVAAAEKAGVSTEGTKAEIAERISQA